MTSSAGHQASQAVPSVQSAQLAQPAQTKASQQMPGNALLDTQVFLRMAVAECVSDIHLRVGYPPILRKDGDMMSTRLPALDEDNIRQFLKAVIPKEVLDRTKQTRDLDFSFSLENIARFRVNMFYEMNQLGLVLRLIPTKIPSLETLHLPSVLERFTQQPKGLILVTGPTGSGKSTTLAALLETMNQKHAKHIVTLEDPVEYVFDNKQCVFTQRQLGLDTDSFPNGLKYALRQDPDVILIGEMRDRETVSSALHAAETGHLVFSTLHTVNAVQTISRIINLFEPHERDPVRKQLADVLMGTVSQRLIKTADGAGRQPACEIMAVTPAIRDYIRRDEMTEIYQMLKSGDFEDVKSLNHSLYLAVANEQVKSEEALKVSEDPNELQQMLRGAFHGTYHA